MTSVSPGRATGARDAHARAGAAQAGAIELRTPAKLNLGLRLMGVRDDGYHLLESVFAPIEVWDRLEIEVQPGSQEIELEVTVDEESGLPPVLSAVTSGPDNLAFRAAVAFCQATGFEARIRIHLEKAIPAAAGLGGGSSDAAAVLSGLAALAGVSISASALDGLALGLGADVPFFLEPRASHVAGIGEIITPLDSLAETELVVANPGISLDTAEVYRAADALGSALTEPIPGSTMRAFSRLCDQNSDPRDGSQSMHSPESASEPRRNPGGDPGGESGRAARSSLLWGELLVNDLEPAARRLCPPVGRLLAEMREAGAIGAGMTGSGATVFGVFESKEAADTAADWLRRAPTGGADSAWIQVSRLIGHG
jgi:4-diphosphocytidyl-2-C-methyl-D-erythritol kinase